MARNLTSNEPELGQRLAIQFGALVRERRRALKMNQNDLALTTGVRRQFIIELEAGKATSHLGRALLVAETLGLRLFDRMSQDNSNNALLPDMPEDENPS
jgi:HTH-type transcriptional regulator / antitoxin HipB